MLPANHFKIYPNPFTEQLIIESIDQLPVLVGVLDLMQQPVKVSKNEHDDHMEITFETVPSGIYIVLLSASNGEISAHKVFKQ